MATIFHITKALNVESCKQLGDCSVADADQHYTSEEAAEEARQAMLQDTTPSSEKEMLAHLIKLNSSYSDLVTKLDTDLHWTPGLHNTLELLIEVEKLNQYPEFRRQRSQQYIDSVNRRIAILRLAMTHGQPAEREYFMIEKLEELQLKVLLVR